MKTGSIARDKITVPDFVERPFNKIADDRDTQSVKKHGIRQPLVLVPDGDRMLLADGLRRLRIAKSLGIAKVPYVEAPAPAGTLPEAYARELRLALDVHRQDLTVSQKCYQEMELKKRFGMNNIELAAYLGVHADSITNHLAVRHYVPEIVQALDSGRLTMGAARVFQGMSEKGQRAIWKKHEAELVGPGKHKLHRQFRKLYPAAKYPEFFRKPEVSEERMKRKQTKAARPKVTTEEKRRLGSSLELRQIELEEGIREEKQLKAEIAAATVPIYAIMRSEKLSAFLTPDMREEMSRFCEIY